MASRRRTWLVTAWLIALAGYGVWWGFPCRGSHHAPADHRMTAPAPAPIDAAIAQPVPDPTTAPGTGVAIALTDATTGAPRGGVTLTARDGGGHTVRATVDDHGVARLPLATGAWTVDAGGLELADGARWQVGEPPPLLPVRVRAPVPPDDAAPPPPGRASLVGTATLLGARVADVVVRPIWLGGFGPGHVVASDHVPRPVSLPARRFVGTAGAWRLDDLPEGGYLVVVIAPGQGAAVVRATATAKLAGDASARLDRAASVSGTVIDQREATLGGARVRALVGDLAVATTIASPAGVFLLDDLPGGDVTIDAHAASCFGDHATLTLAAGARTIHQLSLVCEVPVDAGVADVDGE